MVIVDLYGLLPKPLPLAKAMPIRDFQTMLVLVAVVAASFHHVMLIVYPQLVARNRSEW